MAHRAGPRLRGIRRGADVSKSPTGRIIDERQPIKAALNQQAFLTRKEEEKLDREAVAKWLASFRTRR